MNIVQSHFELKSCNEQGIFCGYASVFGNTDLHQDIMMPGAFKRTLDEEGMPKMFWQHDSALPIGIWEAVHEDHKGLFVKGRLLLDLKIAQEAYALMKSGVVDGLSIGYQTRMSQKKGNVRLITDVDLHEISLVSFAANPLARVLSVKDFDMESCLHNLMTRVRELIV